MRGWMVGAEGRGVQEISTVLTLTRMHSAVAALGYVGRGLGVARAYARVREVGGRGARVKLVESALHMRTLARMTAEYRGLMLLTFFTSYILGLSEYPAPPNLSGALAALTPQKHSIAPLLRVLTQLTKAYVCKASVPLLHSCMEALGGVGYLLNEEQEYLNIARLYRDCSVIPIWEGTTDVLSTDVVRALKHPKGGECSLDALGDSIKQAVEFNGRGVKPKGWDPVQRWAALRERITKESQDDLMGDAREILWELTEILVSVLMFMDAGDGDPAAQDVFDRFVEEKFGLGGGSARDLDRDVAIVYGKGDERSWKL